MKKTFFAIVLLNYLFINVLTAQNPFKELGVDVGVITLSKGKYPEFIPNDTIHRIGTVVIDTRTGKIIELINTDSIEVTYNYRPDVASRWISPDPLAEEYPDWTPYRYGLNNPIYHTDPSGMLESTDVIQNADGSYTVVNAHNDNDCNIYVVNAKGERTGDVIGETMRPYDFMSTNDANGTFKFDKNSSGVTFNLNKLTVSGTVKPNEHTTSTINNADAQELLNWGVELYQNELERQSPATFYGSLEVLKEMSANGAALDFKASLGLSKYTALRAGTNSEGKPIITTLRAIGNMTFGNNMRLTKPYLLGSPGWYYGQVMQQVGAYNQSQNKGNGYNSGHPYYGEHTYSGSYIYYGYFGNFFKK